MSETRENATANVVPIEYWKDFEPDPARPGELREVHYVKWGKRGDLQNYANVISIPLLQKTMKDADHGTAQDPVWVALKPSYEAWLAGQEVPVDGTALEAWPALTKTQVRLFREHKYRTIEDVAAMAEHNLGQVKMPDVRRLRDMARAWMKNREGSAQVEAMFAEQAEKMTAQNEKMAEMQEQLAKATAALARLGDKPEHVPALDELRQARPMPPAPPARR